jgi:hypothetical protein
MLLYSYGMLAVPGMLTVVMSLAAYTSHRRTSGVLLHVRA